MSQRDAWEREYSKPDPMWKGPARDIVPTLHDQTVLELGCGNGKTAAALVRAGAEVVAVDFSRRGLRACSGAVPSPRLALIEADIRHLPFADHIFDTVVAFHVLGHLLEGERGRAVEEIERVLRPGGTVLVRVFARDDMRSGKGERVEEGTYVKGTGIPCHFFTAEELDSLFQGFRALSQEEVRVTKRYDGKDMVRAEWAASYRPHGQGSLEHQGARGR
jgi:SAM-dependent methyltransferase